MKIPVAHSNAHDDLQIANHGITFDVANGKAWFSAARFYRESEHVTLENARFEHSYSGRHDVFDDVFRGPLADLERTA